MKTNELKIGNWVNWNGENGVVSQILEHEVVFKCGEDTLISELKPIELTEEILLKCGFEKDESWGMLFIKRPYLVYHDKYLKTNILGIFISGSYREYQTVSKPFNHLHQLQNLYWCLTNQELEINL